jgi:hypothetical protein
VPIGHPYAPPSTRLDRRPGKDFNFVNSKMRRSAPSANLSPIDDVTAIVRRLLRRSAKDPGYLSVLSSSGKKTACGWRYIHDVKPLRSDDRRFADRTASGTSGLPDLAQAGFRPASIDIRQRNIRECSGTSAPPSYSLGCPLDNQRDPAALLSRMGNLRDHVFTALESARKHRRPRGALR